MAFPAGGSFEACIKEDRTTFVRSAGQTTVILSPILTVAFPVTPLYAIAIEHTHKD